MGWVVGREVKWGEGGKWGRKVGSEGKWGEGGREGG